MPFDALVITKPTSLHDHLALLGITPVPIETLDRHKAEQERLHPAHPLSTPWPLLCVWAFCVVISSCLIIPGIPVSGALATSLIMITGGMMMCLALGVLNAIVLLGDIKIYGKAKWYEAEAQTSNDLLIPLPIREVVQQVRRTMPGTLYLGELRQDMVVLDPYIILVQNGERACLGIWLHDTVIACADVS